MSLYFRSVVSHWIIEVGHHAKFILIKFRNEGNNMDYESIGRRPHPTPHPNPTHTPAAAV